MSTNNLDLIYERWKASLKDKDKSIDFVTQNFNELFDDLNGAGATFEEAHAYMYQAIKAHLPPPTLAKNIWKVMRNNPAHIGKSEKEFIDGWNQDISDKATNSFYNIYELPDDKEEDLDPKVYGGGKISEKEYKLMRSHADKFTPVDLKSLEIETSETLTEEELLDLVRNNTDG